MQFLALKSLRLRSNFKKNELQFIINKFLFIYLLANKYFNKFTIFDKNLIKLFFSLNLKKIKNRCIITNRNKVSNKFFAVSRILLRSSLKFGIISGIKKSVW